MFIPTRMGIVRATSLPPASATLAEASTWDSTRSRCAESTVSTFQLMGRFASDDISESSDNSLSLKRSMQPSTIISKVVPSCAPAVRESATTSLLAANLLGTGWPSPSSWVYASEVENPMPPASMLSSSSLHISSTCSCVASLPTESSPITRRRSALWPTKKATFTPSLPSKRLRYSPKVRQSQGSPCSKAVSGIPSTFTIIRRR